MGSWVSSLFKKYRDIRIIMVGLDNAGKTTILYKLKLGEVVSTIPTIGFNVETVTRNGITMNVWDIGGQTKVRSLWRHYYEQTDAIIFVVDSTDHERFGNLLNNNDESVYCTLKNMLESDSLKGIPLLIMANKCDSKNAVPVGALCKHLDLFNIKDRTWNCVSTSALSGEGIDESLEWLSAQIK